MQRILLVLEDFNELVYLQTILKKIGFDVEGVSQAKKFDDVLLGFNPSAVVLGSKLGKVSGLELARQIKKSSGSPKIALLKPSNTQLDSSTMNENGVDFLIDAPVNVHLLLVGLSSALGIDEKPLIEKLQKLKAKSDNSGQEDSSEAIRSAPEKQDNINVSGRYDIEDEITSVKGQDKDKAEQIEVRNRTPNVNYKMQTEELDKDQKKKDIRLDLKNFAKSADDDEDTDFDFTLKEKLFDTGNNNINVNSGESQLLTSDEKNKKRKRTQEYLEQMESVEDGRFVRDKILDFNKWIRSQPTAEDIEQIEADRKAFVRSLFNKKS